MRPEDSNGSAAGSATGVAASRTALEAGATAPADPAGGDAAAADEVARRIMETAPLVMRTLRRQIRLGSSEGLSIPQFHALAYIRRHPGTGLSELADHVGATLAACSELVNRLVGDGMLSRSPNVSERRRISLTLTAAGEAELEATTAEAQAWLRTLVAGLEPERLRRLIGALSDLHELLETDVADA